MEQGCRELIASVCRALDLVKGLCPEPTKFVGSTEALVELELEAFRMVGPWENRERLKAHRRPVLSNPHSDGGWPL